MADSDNLILKKALEDLGDIQLCDLAWKQANEAKREIILIIRRLWRHYEASQAALTMALEELRQAKPPEVKSVLGDTSGEWK